MPPAVDIERPMPWLTAAVDQRMALMFEMTGGPKAFKSGDFEVVLTTLTEPKENASQWEFVRWNNTCDNCGAYDPKHLLTGHITKIVDGVTFIVTVGACPECGLEDVT